ncbi:hypothetical protein [Phreatobacter stygius]|uniref:Uncharacterized protein n=1 Tax=Phreatobacter stygius TaxID=1940610 RepID=A0A4D7BLG9_9HYPH|nr:hypothetical protein [Phreatobacter stygius]QCI68567.1 hypothetical protein E8M01_32660 [Phreatobacter stygius]
MPRRGALPGTLAGAALVACLAVAPIPLSAQGADPIRLLSGIPGEVMFVRITGAWASHDRRGPTRVVLIRPAPREEAMRLFVQWLALDARSNRFSVVATEEVPEVFDWRVKIDDYRIEPDANGSRMIFDAIVLTNNQRRAYELTIGPPGEVMFSAR